MNEFLFVYFTYVMALSALTLIDAEGLLRSRCMRDINIAFDDGVVFSAAFANAGVRSLLAFGV